MTEFEFDQAMAYIWRKVSQTDGLISETKPWELAKSGEQEKLTQVLNTAAQHIVDIAGLLVPFLPATAEKIGNIFTANIIEAPKEPLFPRVL
jgi:methionyl-tRNA synthetase